MTRFFPWKDTLQRCSDGIQKANEQAPEMSHNKKWTTCNNKYLPGPAQAVGPRIHLQNTWQYRPCCCICARLCRQHSEARQVNSNPETTSHLHRASGAYILQNLSLHSLHSSMLPSPTSPLTRSVLPSSSGGLHPTKASLGRLEEALQCRIHTSYSACNTVSGFQAYMPLPLLPTVTKPQGDSQWVSPPPPVHPRCR